MAGLLKKGLEEEKHTVTVADDGRAGLEMAQLNSVWESGDNVEQNTLDAFVSSLRGKIDHGRRVKLLHTIRGTGYMIREGR